MNEKELEMLQMKAQGYELFVVIEQYRALMEANKQRLNNVIAKINQLEQETEASE